MVETTSRTGELIGEISVAGNEQALALSK